MIEKRLETVRFAFCLWPKTHSTTIIRCSRESKQFNWHRCEIDTKRTHTHESRTKKKWCLIIYTQKGKRTIPETLFIFLRFSRSTSSAEEIRTKISTHIICRLIAASRYCAVDYIFVSFARVFISFFFCSSTTFQCVFQMSNSTAPHRARARTLWAHERVKCGTSTLMYTLVCTNPYSTVCLRAVCRQQVWLNENNKFIFIYLVKMCQRVFAPRHRAKLELCASTSARIRVSRGWLSLK